MVEKKAALTKATTKFSDRLTKYQTKSAEYRACLEKCNLAGKKHTSLMSDPKFKYGAPAVGALVGALALTGGEEAPSTSISATGIPSVAPGTASSATAPVGINPDGSFRVNNISVTGGDASHDCCTGLRNLQGRELRGESGSVIFTGPEPWVRVAGTFDTSTGAFSATGKGSVAGFPNVGVSFEGTLGADGRLTGIYTMGAGGELPGGRPILYRVEATRR